MDWTEETKSGSFPGSTVYHYYGSCRNLYCSNGVPFFMATGNALVLILVTLLPCLIAFYQGFMNEKMASGSIIPSWVMHAVLNILSATTASL